MQYIYGIHAVDSLLRQNPRSVQRLWVQQGREDKRIASVVELANNQGVRRLNVYIYIYMYILWMCVSSLYYNTVIMGSEEEEC